LRKSENGPCHGVEYSLSMSIKDTYRVTRNCWTYSCPKAIRAGGSEAIKDDTSDGSGGALDTLTRVFWLLMEI
jgi:hypothetical protein